MKCASPVVTLTEEAPRQAKRDKAAGDRSLGFLFPREEKFSPQSETERRHTHGTF